MCVADNALKQIIMIPEWKHELHNFISPHQVFIGNLIPNAGMFQMHEEQSKLLYL